MGRYMLEYFLETVFIVMMMYGLDGVLFLQRVLLVIFFDFDYVEKGREWVKKAQEGVHRVIQRLKETSEMKRKKENEEAKTVYIIDKDMEKEFED